MTLYDELKEYCASDVYPFHMPGHKRRAAWLCDPRRIDLTEIDGFDNLHHAEGILRDAEMRAARLFKSSETHFLVNGSTAGILSAIGACTLPGKTLLMARNSHRSAFNAAALNRVTCAYLSPSDMAVPCDINGRISPEQVERALGRSEQVCAVFLTSPTYDGVVSDVAGIAEAAHRHGIPLIVDEAHGAHFGMHPLFPESSVKLGADVVIHSLHKTLPALTQTALIHVNGDLVDRARLRRLLSVYQTSSPSYVLMASIDQCIHLLSEEGPALFDAFAQRLDHFYRETELKHLSLLRTDDPSRILIRPPASSPDREESREQAAMHLYHTLRRRFRLQPEMASVSYVLMLSSVCDDDTGFTRLKDALLTLDLEYEDTLRKADLSVPKKEGYEDIAGGDGISPDMCYTLAQALDARTDTVPFASSEGRISAEFLTLYPPGIPLLLPGERITASIIHRALILREKGYSLPGPADRSLRTIQVCKEIP